VAAVQNRGGWGKTPTRGKTPIAFLMRPDGFPLVVLHVLASLTLPVPPPIKIE